MDNVIDVSKMQGIEEQRDWNAVFNLCGVPQSCDIEEPESIFEINDIPVFTRKSISVKIGKAKSGKTTSTAYEMKSILPQYKVLWCDTEQGLYYASRTQTYILKCAGFKHNHHLIMIDLKKFKPSERLELIKVGIERIKPDLVVLDGLRDIAYDINSSEEAVLIIGELMRIAEEYDCHISTILHQNKGDNNARGHLGSEIVNKSEIVISVSKYDEVPNSILVKTEYSRGLPPEDYILERDEEGTPILSDHTPSSGTVNSKTSKLIPVEVARETHLEILTKIFEKQKEFSSSQFNSEIVAAFEQFDIRFGLTKAKTFAAFYSQKGYVERSRGKGNGLIINMADSFQSLDVKISN